MSGGTDSNTQQDRTSAISGVTARSVLVGAALCLGIGVADPYSVLAVQSPSMTFDMSAPGAIFLFFVLVGVVNTCLRRIRYDLALTRSELVTVYIMMLIASAIPNRGVMSLIPVIAAPYYYKTPENQWDENILPYIRDWLVPNDNLAAKYLYEGLPQGMPTPWMVWIQPLLIWFSFFIVLYVVMIAMMVILRKQWMDNERLVYPIMQLPMDMLREEGRGSLVNPFFKNAIMWLGFAIPCIVLTLNALHDYLHILPRINLNQRYLIFRNQEELFVYIVFSIIGFTYFVNLRIAFSLWFFNLVFKVQKASMSILGWTVSEQLGPYSPGRSAIHIHQDMGAMIVLVLVGVWMGRGHLRDVFNKALRGDSKVDDSAEIMSYRAAVLCIVVGFAYLAFWLWLSGIPMRVLPLLLGGAFVLFVALTRIVAEAGIAWVAGPITAPALVASGLGTSSLGAHVLVPVSFSFVWAGEVKTSVMAFAANGLRLVEHVTTGRRRLFWAMLLAATTCFIGSAWAMLNCGYDYGGINLGPRFSPFGVLAQAPFAEYAGPFSRNPAGIRWDGWFFTAMGGAGMSLLMLAQHRLLWWPFHPLGFAISSVWAIHFVWFSIFIAWSLKAMILKYGGPKIYAKLKPFFVGLILGEFVTQGAWLVIDAMTGVRYVS